MARADVPQAREEPGHGEDESVNGNREDVRDELYEKLVVADADAVVHPGAVVVHL